MGMMNPRDNISMFQFIMLLSVAISAVGFLDIRGIAKDITINTWIPVLLTLFISPLFIWVTLKLAAVFPEKIIISYLPEITGKHLGFILGFFLNLYYLLISAIAFKLFMEITRVYLLVKTPLEVMIFVQLLVLLFASWQGINSIARFTELTIPMLTFLFFFFILITIIDCDLANIFPIAENGLLPVLKKVSFTLPNYLAIGLISFLYPFINRKNKLTKPVLSAILVTGGIIFLLDLNIVGVFGEEIADLYFPSIAVFQRINIPFMFIERIVLFLLLTILPILFIFNLLTYFVSALGFTTLFNLRDHTVFTLLLLPLYFLIINIPISVADVFWLRETARWAAVIVLFLPVILLVIVKFKKRMIG